MAARAGLDEYMAGCAVCKTKWIHPQMKRSLTTAGNGAKLEVHT
jgi:hypothetical protein